jgi:hypothetical protein
MRKIVISILLCTAGPTLAAETITYTYDALGRLTSTASSGSVNNGISTTIGYDPAGNRSNYVSGTGGGGGGSGGGGGGGGGGGTSSMTPINPSETLSGSTVRNFLPTKFAANGVSPIIQSFTIPSGGGSATIASGGTSVTYTTPAANVGSCASERGADRVFSISVVIRDSSNATVTSNYSVTILGRLGTGICQ